MPDVAIILGSESDWEKRVKGKGLTETLDALGVSYKVSPQISAHRHPLDLEKYCAGSDAKVFITAAGLSAALPGTVAGHLIANGSMHPVIGVALTAGSFGAIDAMMSQVAMPPGVPVSFAGADGQGLVNAALLAALNIATDPAQEALRIRMRSHFVGATERKPPKIDVITSEGKSDSKEAASIECLLARHYSGVEFEHVHSGKVRELFAEEDEEGQRIVLASTNRISAFDKVMGERVPYKGAVLNGLSAFWFERLQGIVPNHLFESDFLNGTEYAGQVSYAKRLTPVPAECIIRALITGSMWSAFKKAEAVGAIKTVLGIDLWATMSESQMFKEPLFTPSTKAEIGHDENLTEEQTRTLLKKWVEDLPDEQKGFWADRDLFDELKRVSLELFKAGAEYAAERGIILADTKFEFGLNAKGEIVLMDEVFTPDSSRFVFEEDYVVGEKLVCRDKQILRDYLQKLVDEGKWNKEYPAPPLPQYLIDEIEQVYLDMYQRLVGHDLELAT